MDHRNWVEWVVLVISVVAVTSVVGVLIFDGVTGTEGPPKPIVKLHPDKAYITSTGWLLPATVSNEGERSAESVTFLATATVQGQEQEAEVNVDYLPAGTDVSVTFGFSGKPEGGIVVRVTGLRQ